MNLSEPLDGLLSAVESAVLRVVARSDAGFSGRQIHALARAGSTSSVQRALTRFVAVGLLIAEPRPPAIIYRANRAHVLWPAVESGLGARRRVFDSIRAFCDEVFSAAAPSAVIVYGSVARQESSLDSDIDLFVVHADTVEDEARSDMDYKLAEHVETITGNAAQVYSVLDADFRQRVADDDPLVQNVLREGIVVCGELPRSMTASAA